MDAVKRFLYNDHIQGALVSGFCIILLALFFKKVEHIPVPAFESAVPGLMFTLYEAIREKGSRSAWSRIEPWTLMMLLATGLIILKRLLM